MKIAICDDDEYYRGYFTDIVRKYTVQNKPNEITLNTFTHAEELLDSVSKNGGYDIYILDIIMPGMNGIELGKHLRQMGFDENIIYLTTSDEFAVASYRVNATDYILKPPDDDEFIKVLDKTIKSVANIKNKFVLVKTKSGSIKLNFDNIVYAELIKRTVVYHMKDGSITESVYIRTNFDDTVKPLTEDARFARCGKSILLNMHHISAVENEAIVFDTGNKISTGKKLCREVHNTWVKFNFSEVEST